MTGRAVPIVLDDASLLIEAHADVAMGDVARFLRTRKRVLRGAPSAAWDDRTLRAWLAAGAPAEKIEGFDPVDHLIAGFSARDENDLHVSVPPSPRRSAGPDLTALFFGCDPPLLALERVWLRVEDAEGTPPRGLAPKSADPQMTPEERAIFARTRDAMGRGAMRK